MVEASRQQTIGEPIWSDELQCWVLKLANAGRSRTRPRRYVFVTRGTTGNVRAIHAMKECATELKYEWFRRALGDEQLKTFGEQRGYENQAKHGRTLRGDHRVKYFRSWFDGRPALFLVHEQTTYVWVTEIEELGVSCAVECNCDSDHDYDADPDGKAPRNDKGELNE